jgi:RecB family exonuclease
MVQPASMEEEMQVFGLGNQPWIEVDAFPEINRTPYFEMGKDLKEWVRKNLLRINPKTNEWELNTDESPTSLDNLIQKPMKWFLSKLDHFRDSNAINFESESLQKGNAFHRLVEYALSMEKAERTETRLRELLNDAIMEKAAFLFLPENRIQLNEFLDDARESLSGLLEFIRLNDFEVIGTEKSFEITDNQEIPVRSLKGKADLLLKNKKDEKIVIDLKWSSKADKFRRLINENDALQLSVYSLIEEGITSMAYLVFPEKELIGGLQTWIIPPSLNRPASIPEFTIENAENTLVKLKNSILFRAKELAGGKVETGSGFGPEELPYMIEQEGRRISKNEEKTQYQTELLTITKAFQ